MEDVIIFNVMHIANVAFLKFILYIFIRIVVEYLHLQIC